MLKFPPLKSHPLTRFIVIKSKSKNTGHYVYKMLDRNGNIAGRMEAHPETLYNYNHIYSPNADVYDSFCIDRLFSYDRNKGAGRAFINIAKKESFKNFCIGNIHLIATNRYDIKHPSQIFYRKAGFKFGYRNNLTEKIIDDYIKGKTPEISGKIPLETPMYIETNVDSSGKLRQALFNFKIRFPEIFEWI